MTAFDEALAKVKDIKEITKIIGARMTFTSIELEPRPCEIENCQCPHGDIELGTKTRHCDAGWIINENANDDEPNKYPLGKAAWACPQCRPYLSQLQKESHYDVQSALWKRNKMLREGSRKDHL